jgi:membrane protease YdiL (CAAX protease family)
MANKAHFSDFSSQKPIIQLFISVCVVIIAGTLLFYLFLLAGSLFFNTDVTKMLSVAAASANSYEVYVLKFIQGSQQVAMFIIPAIFLGYMFKDGKVSFLKLDRIPESGNVIIVILLTIMMIPLNSYTGLLNSKLAFPDWFSGIERWMRTKEDIATTLTALLIKTNGIRDLIINIFILAIIPAIAEELIFRGILQQILCKLFRSPHAGIWITAIFFSAIHMQFFGFIPRLILGLCFGYLYFWTSNLWLPIVAHFINNLVPVVMSWFFNWNDINEKASDLAGKQFLLPLVPTLISIVCIYYFWTEYKRRVGKNID